MEKLKKFRLSKNLTMKQVAERVGIAECTYCAYEHGKRKPDIQKLAKIARVYECTIDELVEQEDKAIKGE